MLKRATAVLLSFLIAFNPIKEKPTDLSPWLNFDPFEGATSKKGMQGSDICGARHTLINHWMLDSFPADPKTDHGNVTWEYEGETYTFYDIFTKVAYRSRIKTYNKKGITVSVVLLMDKNGTRNRLIDPPARKGRKNTLYYQLNVTEPENKKEIEAYFDYLAYNFSRNDCHIDNWILGNEVNMPNIWNYYGTKDVDEMVQKYGDAYMMLYKAVRRYTDYSRVSISLDHSWNDSDEGRGVGARTFLDKFVAYITEQNGGKEVDWCLAYHPYPAVLTEPDIWAPRSRVAGVKLNPDSPNARFADGANLHVVTDYIRENYGESHRVMATEFGASMSKGEEVQAACLTYTYYACKYDDMIDCFLYLNANEDSEVLDFQFNSRLAKEVYKKIDTGKPEDVKYVEDVVLPVIGVDDFREIIPEYDE